MFISNVSQMLRVGYGLFISDLMGQLKTARTTAAAVAAAAAAATVTAYRAGSRENPQSDTHVPGGFEQAGVAVASTIAAETSGAGAVIDLQRFGGNCVRNLTKSAAAFA